MGANGLLLLGNSQLQHKEPQQMQIITEVWPVEDVSIALQEMRSMQPVALEQQVQVDSLLHLLDVIELFLKAKELILVSSKPMERSDIIRSKLIKELILLQKTS